MVQLSTLAALLVSIPLTLAHPGENFEAINNEMALRNVQHAKASRSLSNCQSNANSVALRARTAARRAEKTKELRAKRGLVNRSLAHQKRDLESLDKWAAIDHNQTTTEGYTLDTPMETIFGSNNTCALVPETTIGPYYVTGEQIRSDITEGQSGIPLRLELQFVDMNTCEPVEELVADIWHCNATGTYSGIGIDQGQGGLDSTFMRGVQLTDSEGVVEFDTIFPGHYASRLTHIHVVSQKNVTIENNGTYTGGTTLHVGQLYLDDALISAVEATAPYNTNTIAYTDLDLDGWALEEATTDYNPFMEYVQLSDDLADGILAWITVAVDLSSDHSSNLTAAAYRYEEGGVANPNPDKGLPPSNPNAS